MLYLVKMTVKKPAGMPEGEFVVLKERERVYSEALQRAGTWKHLWRVAGAYANVSIFDVAGPEHLHEVMTGLPFFPFLDIDVTALIAHPSAISPTSTPAKD